MAFFYIILFLRHMCYASLVSQGRLCHVLVRLGGIEFFRCFMWSFRSFQFSWRFWSSNLLRNSVVNAAALSFSFPQSALFQMGTIREVFLLIYALSSMSARMMPSWSDIQGIVLRLFTSLGLLVQKRSSTVSFLVGSHCSWCRWLLFYVLMIFSHIAFLLESH